MLLVVLAAFGVFTPIAVHQFEASATPVRILVSVGTLLPLGFFMGMAFPIGMRRALADAPAFAPWLWGGQRRGVGLRVGAGRGDCARRGDLGFVLGGRRLLLRRVRGAGLVAAVPRSV